MGGQEASLAELLVNLEARLLPHSESARLDAQVLLGHITGKPRAWILAHPEEKLSPIQFETYQQAAERVERGEPLPYVIGHWEFYGMEFLVTPEVLIPRPETEVLVQLAIEWLQAHPERRWTVDVGTGSGCIAIALAVKLPDLRLAATDISPGALEVARMNAERHGVAKRIDFYEADMLELQATGAFDLLCANLPYIPQHQLKDLQVSRWEPVTALNGGKEGLDLILRLLEQSANRMAAGGLMLLEIEASQGDKARSLARSAFPDAYVRLHQDLAGLDRVLEIKLP